MTFFSDKLYAKAKDHEAVPKEIYSKYQIKRGLRNEDGTGVLAGLTSISNVHVYVVIDDEKIPDEGRLTIRGYDLKEMIAGIKKEGRYGFEDLVFLLLFGSLPNKDELAEFNRVIDSQRDLPEGFVHSLVLTAPSDNAMNMMARSILNLYAYDANADIPSLEHEIDVACSLISRLPRIAPLAYYAYEHSARNKEMIWNPAKDGLSAAETILYMLRKDGEYTKEEALLLDTLLMLHAEHGGGNNSTFTCRVLSSSGTDAYAAYAGALSSLKGPKHGGANIKVSAMLDNIMEHADYLSDDGLKSYLEKILNKQAFDNQGLIYGMGHAVYTKSDPRAKIIVQEAQAIASSFSDKEQERFDLIQRIEKFSPELIAKKTKSFKEICANIDMYTGFLYKHLGIPDELITPMFAIARISGWAAHRIEEKFEANRIIRPAYKARKHHRDYLGLSERA